MSERARVERPDLWRAVYALPDPDTPLLGRDSERATLQEALNQGARLLTLTGPAGIGKTRLALELTRQHATEGVSNAFLRLAPVRDAAMVARLLASVCALDGWPDLPIERFPRDLVRVLVLDGFDHVHDAGASITSILERCPNVKVIVTSREAVHIPGETAMALGPIDPDAASALLALHRQAPHHEPEVVQRLITFANGNPLALELLGGRFRSGRPVHIESPAGTRLQLADVIACVIDALAPEARRLFARLCISAAQFEANVVASLAECLPRVDGDVTPHIAAMTRLGLLRTHESGELAARFEIPAAIRELGLASLNASGDLAAVRLAYAAHMLQRAMAVRDLLAGARRNAALVWFEREYDGLRLTFGTFVQLNRVQQARAMAVALLPYWLLRRRYREARRWLTVALELTGAPFSDDIEQELLVALGLIELLSGRLAAARTRSLAGARSGIPGSQIGWRGAALATLGMLAGKERDYERAIGLYRVYLEATRSAPKDASWTPQLRTLTRLAMSSAYMAEGDHDEAEYYATMAFKRGLALGDPLLVGYARVNLGAIALAKQDLGAALEFFRDGILLLLDQPATGAASAGVLGLAKVALQLHAHAIAVRLLELARWLLDAGSPMPPYLVAFDPAEMQAVIDDALRPAGVATDISFTHLSDAISTVTQSVHELLVAQTPPTIPPARNRKGGLSSRELEVLCLAAEDMTDLEIADALFISKRTASDHMRNVIAKLGVQSRTGAVARALRDEWCS